ncbi:MAG: hypothetical protein VW270_19465, partial [Candidatus Poseidoniales archaeon]
VTTNRTAANEITVNLDADVSVTSVAATTPISPSSGGTGQDLSAATGSVYVASGTVSAVDMGTKGDLLVGDGSAAPSTLSVGSNNQALLADSTTATGLKWGAVPSGGVTISGTAAEDFTAGDPALGFDSSGQITKFKQRGASAGRNWDQYGGGHVSSDVLIPDSSSTYSSIKNSAILNHYLTGEDCILALYVKTSDDYLYGRVGTLASNGATTWGTETLIASTAFDYGAGYYYQYAGQAVSLTPLESTVGSGKMLVSYQPTTATSTVTSIYHRVLTIVGGTTRSISVGAEQTETVTSGYNGTQPGIEGASGSGEAVVLHSGGASTSASYIKAVGITISGSSISFGSSTTIGSWSGSGTSYGSKIYASQLVTGAYNVTRDSYAVIYYDYSLSTRLYIRSFTQSGTTLTASTAVEVANIFTDVTFPTGTIYENCAVALVWDTPNTRWVCNLIIVNYLGYPYRNSTRTLIGAFTEASVGTYAKVGNTLLSTDEKLTDSTFGVFAHQYSWNTSEKQGLRALLNNSLSTSGTSYHPTWGFSDVGALRLSLVNINDYTINPYLRYDSADSAWYAHGFAYITKWMGATDYTDARVYPLHYKLTFDGTDWTVVKATLIDAIDTNVGQSLSVGSSYNGWKRTMYDPDNDCYIKIHYHFSNSTATGVSLHSVAAYNATGDSLVGEAVTYMIWDDDDINNYAGLYMIPAANLFGTASNTVTAGGALTVNIGDHVNSNMSFPSIPTGKPLSRAAVGPDGTFVTHRTRILEYPSGDEHLSRAGTAVGTSDLLFGFKNVAMP